MRAKPRSGSHTFYFGNGTPGLRELVVRRRTSASIDPRGVSTIPIGDDDTGTRSSCASAATARTCSARRTETASLPPDIAPDELTVEVALDLIEQAGRRVRRRSGQIPRPSLPVYVLTGRFGPYVQLGEQEDGNEEEAEARVAVRVADARDGHARRSAAAAVAAACRRHRRRRTRDRRVARSVRSVPQARRRRHAQPRGRGAAAHGHAGRGRGAVRAAEAAARPPAEAAARRARRASRHGRAGARARRSLRRRTSPTAR